MKISKLKDLIKLVENSKIAELEISRFGTKVRIRKSLEPSPHKSVSKPELEIDLPQRLEEKEALEKGDRAIKAPMVGTFYRAPAADADPYVRVGDQVRQGQVVCIIEAMKVMNEIQSEIEGKIVRILAENESAVEYGQDLFHLE